MFQVLVWGPGILSAWGVLSLAACDSPSPPEPPREPPRAPSGRPAAMAEVAEPAAWPARVESLAESLEAFEDRASCEAALRARVPVEIAELLEDLHYETVFADACTGLLAVQEGDASLCSTLSTSMLRDGCVRRVAVYGKRPELCPEATGVDGRDPLCLAWALRSLAACDAAASFERDLCEAVLANDATRCEGTHAARCAGLVRRLGPSMSDIDRARPRRVTELVLRVQRPDGSELTRFDLGAEVARGIYIRADGCARRVELGARRPLLGERAGPSLRVTPAGVTGTVPIDGIGRDVVEGAVSGLAFDADRGTAVDAHVVGRLVVSGEELLLDGELRSYVRDRDPLGDGC